MGNASTSWAWEVRDGWERLVCEPVVRHAMAPRDARAILAAAGIAVDDGVPPERIIEAIRATDPHGTARRSSARHESPAHRR